MAQRITRIRGTSEASIQEPHRLMADHIVKEKKISLVKKTNRKAWRASIEKVLLSETQIQSRVRRLARTIENDYRGKDLVIVSLLNGTVLFLADLIRQIDIPLRLDFIGVSSYRGGTSSRSLFFTKELQLDVQGRDVLLVDDILDTGKTLDRVTRRLLKLRPRRLKICVLLKKEVKRLKPVEANYVGFVIPDLFVVGYGLDYAERFRNLPFLGILKHPTSL